MNAVPSVSYSMELTVGTCGVTCMLSQASIEDIGMSKAGADSILAKKLI